MLYWKDIELGNSRFAYDKDFVLLLLPYTFYLAGIL
jgi:hypothetical protein